MKKYFTTKNNLVASLILGERLISEGYFNFKFLLVVGDIFKRFSLLSINKVKLLSRILKGAILIELYSINYY